MNHINNFILLARNIKYHTQNLWLNQTGPLSSSRQVSFQVTDKWARAHSRMKMIFLSSGLPVIIWQPLISLYYFVLVSSGLALLPLL
jgi:hypothetical protein